MAIKLFELIENWFGEIISKNIKDGTSKKVTESLKDFKKLDDTIFNLGKTLNEERKHLDFLIKSHGKYNIIVEEEKKKIENLEKEIQEKEKKQKKLLKDLSDETNLSIKEIKELADEIELFGENAINAGLATQKFKNIMSKATSALGFDLKALATEFFSLAAVIGFATDQIVRNNKFLVESARKTGGVLNYRQLGFDAYGNNQTNTGSLGAIADINNISEEQFFEALGGFSKGKVIGQDYSKSAGDLQRFATEQAKLIKLYGASAGDVQRITEISTQLYGVSINQLNKEFEIGAKTAKMAGLNVQEYFKNLARASELIGETFIAGGTKGLERLAMFATKLNSSVDNLVKVGNNFKTISDIFSQQAKGTNLGLNNYAQQAGLLFAKTQLGLYEEANKIAITALSRDVQKYTDKNGVIDQRGIRALSEMGFDKEYIQLIQRTIQAQKRLGVSFEELTDISKLSSEKQFEYYQEMNRSATIQEKLNKLWGQFKSVILDPIASILGPLLDISINLLISSFQALYTILKPVIYGFQIIGKGLSNIADKIAGVTGWIEEKFKKLGIASGKTGEFFEKLTNIAGTLIAAFLTLRAAAYASAAAQNMSGKIGNIGSLVGDFLPGRGKAMARLAGRRFGGLAGGALKMAPKLVRGLGIGMLGGLAGDAISSLGPEGGLADRAGGALSGAATGAAIGSIIPGVGTAIGAAIGGVLGAIGFEDIKKGIMKLVDWASFLKPIWNILGVIKDKFEDWFGKAEDDANKKIAEAYQDTHEIYSKLNNTLNQRIVDPLKAEKAQEKILQNLTKPIIHVENGIGMGDAKVKLSGF